MAARRRQPLTEEQSRLAAEHWDAALETAKLKIKRMRCPDRFRDELMEYVGEAVVEAARTFDPSRGVSFRTHLDRRIWGKLCDVIRSSTGGRLRREVPKVMSIYAGMVDHDPDSPAIAEIIPADEEPLGWDTEWQEVVERLSRCLTPYQAEIFRRAYTRADCVRLKSAGESVGVSESCASQHMAAAYKTLAARRDTVLDVVA